ncbi:hypothetical protein BegalDRAFT_3084 [Beggiatoa alba B18LD]|uniref:ADP-ribosylation/crystallin J1 n=1 Tax=Beggiatoa alba B18LD TaxID=395493 RepID=I3CJW6_9GAMM|nr:hypothetical protein [Beggiatoa alba]EIJ43909.1 hypothetical protein BegalDRAFT_3084 [Beggiatoa alba B18LD]
MKTVICYRPTGAEEFTLIKASGFKKWSPRLPEQPIFYPVTNELYAVEIAKQWNVPAYGVGYVMMFRVNQNFMSRYKIHKVGGAHHTEWWIPAKDLEMLNMNIVGLIEVIGEYHA